MLYILGETRTGRILTFVFAELEVEREGDGGARDVE